MVMTLGSTETLSLREAREMASEKRREINLGEDPVTKAKQFRDEDTLNQLFEAWIEGPAKMAKTKKGLAPRSKRNIEEDRRRYSLYLKEPFGTKKLSWFTTTRIRKWHHQLLTKPKQRGNGTISPTTANQAFSLLRRIFNTMRPELDNPCTGISKFREQSRERFLQPDEMKRFFAALHHPGTSELLRDYVLISLFTGARRSNVLSMMWSEISFNRALWTIPASKSKNRDAMTIPLVDNALEILKHRKQLSASVFVFPGKGAKGHYTEPKKAWKTLLKRSDLKDVRLHDLRRTMGSYQTMTGASTAVVGKTLGHSSPASTAVYARLNLDPVRASMKKAVEKMLNTQQLPEKIVEISNADR